MVVVLFFYFICGFFVVVLCDCCSDYCIRMLHKGGSRTSLAIEILNCQDGDVDDNGIEIQEEKAEENIDDSDQEKEIWYLSVCSIFQRKGFAAIFIFVACFLF